MNLGFPNRQDIEMLKTKYPKGTRIELDNMEDTWAVPSGTKGTVEHVDDAGQIQITWDNGRSLALIPGVDSFHTIMEQRQELKGMAL